MAEDPARHLRQNRIPRVEVGEEAGLPLRLEQEMPQRYQQSQRPVLLSPHCLYFPNDRLIGTVLGKT